MISGAVWIRRGAAASEPSYFEMTDEQYAAIMQRSQLEIQDAKESLREAQTRAAAAQGASLTTASGEPSSFSSAAEEEEEEAEGDKSRRGKKSSSSLAAKSKKDKKKGGKRKKEESAAAETVMMEDVEGDLARFNLETYSDGGDSDIAHDSGDQSEDAEQDILAALSTIDAAALDDDDPYLRAAEAALRGAKEPTTAKEELDEEDLDDLRIRPTDNLLVACQTEDDLSYLQVYVYEEGDENLYVHHDVMLASFPLCVEWIGAPLAAGQTTHGNFAAVGTFEPEIELWNLDMLEVPLPSVVLGTPSAEEKRRLEGSKGGRSTRKKTTAASASSKLATRHTDAVMSLSWNRLHANMLLSGSSDTTVKLWDLARATALRSYVHHQDKVQALKWNPTEASLMASAGYDRQAMVVDCRTPGEVLQWSLLADPECLCWYPQNPSIFTVSDEEGRVMSFDTRAGSASRPLFTLAAHPKAVTAIDWNPVLPNCLMTASADKTVKLWNTAGGDITCVATRELSVGKIFAASFCFDSPGLVSVAGSRGVLSVVNLLSDSAITEGFKIQ